MIQETINWHSAIETIAKNMSISKMEVCRRAGIGGNAARQMISASRHVEPRHDEGVSISKQYAEATNNAAIPAYKRKDKIRCNSCCNSYLIDFVFRVSDGIFKCHGCLRRIEIEATRKQTQSKLNLSVA